MSKVVQKKKKKMWGLIEEAVLRGIGSLEVGVEEYFYIFLDARQGYAYTQKQRWQRYERRLQGKELFLEQKAFSSFLSRLKKDGLIMKTENEWKITPKGIKKSLFLTLMRKRQEIVLNSTAMPAGKHILIIFDIPEAHRKKRAWLRWILRDLGYSMIQRSVWMGDQKVPESFLEVIKDLKIAPYIEIFEVSKLGTLAR